MSDAVLGRVVAARAAGASTPAIARALNEEGVPTARGKRWYPSPVQRILDSAGRDLLGVE